MTRTPGKALRKRKIIKTPGNTGLQEQLGHRDQDPLIKDADSDFPEPGNNEEHTGEGDKKSA